MDTIYTIQYNTIQYHTNIIIIMIIIIVKEIVIGKSTLFSIVYYIQERGGLFSLLITNWRNYFVK